MARCINFTCSRCDDEECITTLGDYDEAVEDIEAQGWEKINGKWFCDACIAAGERI